MKLKLNKVIFINLLFRIFLLVYLLKEEKVEKPANVKTLKHWLDPISKRVILIFVNGLERSFLRQNSTPFLREVLENGGAFGIVVTGYMQTNHGGIRAVLTGKNAPSFPFAWMNAKCKDTVMDYVGFACGMGSLPLDLSWKCVFPNEDPLQGFQKFPELFELKERKSSLYVLSTDLDPVSLHDYPSRLRKIDDQIRFLATMVNNFHGDNKTTYILTSARGSPVGNSLSTDAPVIIWGKSIEYYEGILFVKQADLTALLCALLGINFPSGLVGTIPMDILNLEDHHHFKLILYMIRYFEVVLELVDAKDHLIDSGQLEMGQVNTRLDHIIQEAKKAKMFKWRMTSYLLILLLGLWGVNLTSYASSGFAPLYFHLKSWFLLLLVVGTTLNYSLLGLELLVALEILLFFTWQNSKQILEAFAKNAAFIFKCFFLIFGAVTLIGLIGNDYALPLTLLPVVLWPVLDGSYLRLNRFVLVARLASGIVLGALPFNRIFGELPDGLLTLFSSFFFLIHFYFVLSVFKKELGVYMRINFLMIMATTAHVYFIRRYDFPAVRDALSCAFLAFSFLSVYLASGTLLEKLFKILLSLFIPVLMLNIQLECIFYLTAFFQMFSWVFTDYHTLAQQNLLQYQFYPSVFSIKPKKPSKPRQFSFEDARHVLFLMAYSYVFYFAIGHFPDLHSYDLYVAPNFLFRYPRLLSYFLGGFKFFLPFFIVTTSFLTLCLVKEKDFKPLILVAVWLSDLVGSLFILYSHIATQIFRRTVFPAKFAYFVIQQFATLSLMLSYFLAKHLLLTSRRFFPAMFRRPDLGEQAFKQ